MVNPWSGKSGPCPTLLGPRYVGKPVFVLTSRRTHSAVFSAYIGNGQTRSPITHSNWQGTGVEPDVATTASDALVAAYKLALQDTKPSVESEELTKERQLALQYPQTALGEEITGFRKN
jgi:hypothetical protein